MALNPKNLAPGQEQHEYFKNSITGNQYCQYDYRDKDGELFSCVGKTFDACQTKRDEWLSGRN